MNTVNYDAALDLSGTEASFAVAANGQPVLTASQPMRGRSAAALLTWMQSLLQQKQLELNQITRWTVGSGPGSFSGLRMAAALVQGLTFGRENEVKTRCLPTALGLAAEVPAADGRKIACLFDGRNNELLLFGVIRKGGQLEPDGVTCVIDRNNASEVLAGYDFLASFERDRQAVTTLLPDAASRVVWVAHLPVAAMLQLESDNWNNDLTSLVYIRQAVFVKPNL